MTYGKITNKQREVLEYLKQQVLQKVIRRLYVKSVMLSD